MTELNVLLVLFCFTHSLVTKGSHVAQLVGSWTYNPRVMGSIPSDANCFMWDNILG